MSYREKTAWLALLAMLIAFVPYFALVARATEPQTLPDLPLLGLFTVAAFVQLLVLGVGQLLLRRAAGQEARLAPDERDQAISRRSLGVAYGVLMVGMILVGVVMPFHSSGWAITNAALCMIVLAQLVYSGVSVLNYRRQAG